MWAGFESFVEGMGNFSLGFWRDDGGGWRRLGLAGEVGRGTRGWMVTGRRAGLRIYRGGRGRRLACAGGRWTVGGGVTVTRGAAAGRRLRCAECCEGCELLGAGRWAAISSNSVTGVGLGLGTSCSSAPRRLALAGHGPAGKERALRRPATWLRGARRTA